MQRQTQAGKGDKPRKGVDNRAYWERYDAIFRKPKPQTERKPVPKDKPL